MSPRFAGVLCAFAAATLGCAGTSGTGLGDATNLALGKPVSISGHGETSLAPVVTDGRLAPEGAPADDVAVGVDGVRSALLVDLGSEQEVGALLLQADSHDVYFVEASSDEARWDVVWRVAPAPGMGSLRTRTTALSPAVRVRWLRVRPTTGRSPSVSELQAFRAVPTSWPAGTGASGAPLWPSLTGPRLATLTVAISALALVAAAWTMRVRRSPPAPGEDRLRRGFLIAVAAAAVAAWFNFGNFHYPGFVHTWEVFHYYMGAKYLPELGYTRLYACAATADVDDGFDLRGHVMRDLRTNQVVPVEDQLTRADECRRAFSPRRWDDFKADARFFRGAMGQGWLAVRNDHGFNATPVWAVAGGIVSRLGPASWAQVSWLVALDIALLAATLLVLGRTFGLEAACLAAAFFGTNTLAPFVWTGGGFLRYDWLFALVAGIAALAAGRPTLAGFALAYAALLRLFPAVALAGLVLKAVAEAAAARTARPLVRLAPVAVGATLALVLLGGGSLLAGGGSVWSAFADNTAKHAASISSNRIGLRVLLAYDAGTRLQLTTDPRLADRHETWRTGVARGEARARPIQVVVLVLAAWLLARAARPAPDWAAAVLGLALMPIAFELSAYYYSGFAAWAALAVLHPGAGLALAVLAWASNVVMGLWSFPDEQHAMLSLLVVLFALGIPGALVWRGRTAPAREPKA